MKIYVWIYLHDSTILYRSKRICSATEPGEPKQETDKHAATDLQLLAEKIKRIEGSTLFSVSERCEKRIRNGPAMRFRNEHVVPHSRSFFDDVMKISMSSCCLKRLSGAQNFNIVNLNRLIS